MPLEPRPTRSGSHGYLPAAVALDRNRRARCRWNGYRDPATIRQPGTHFECLSRHWRRHHCRRRERGSGTGRLRQAGRLRHRGQLHAERRVDRILELALLDAEQEPCFEIFAGGRRIARELQSARERGHDGRRIVHPEIGHRLGDNLINGLARRADRRLE